MANRLTRALLAGAATVLLVAGVPTLAFGQAATVVSGRVVNEAGLPVTAATVSIEGTQLGALSDSAGRYTFSVPGSRRGPTLFTIRRIGFRMAQQTVTLGGSPVTLNWTIATVPTVLEGVTVTALSIQREKATIGTSQQSLTGEDLTQVQAPNLISAMSGKVSGVTITQNGNMGGSSRVVIRGAGSILGQNQPLFIIDGIPIMNTGFSNASERSGRDYGTAIADLNPDDIASMTVLKGPNAAALYGSRASNGAVVISTKSGRNAPPGTQISYTSRFGLEQPSILPNYQNKYGQGFAGEFQYVDGAGSGVNDGGDESWGPKLDGRLIDQFNGKQLPWIAHPDNVKDYFQTGNSFSNTLNVVTSGRGMGARFSLTKENTTGIVPNSSLGKLAGSVSASAVVMEKLTLSGSLNYTQNSGNNRPENGYTEGNPFMTFTWFGRQVDVQSLKDHYYNTNSPYGFADGSLYNWNDNYHRNPYWQVFKNAAPDTRDRVIGQVAADYQINSWLSGLVRMGGDSYRQTMIEEFAAGNIDRASPSFNGGFSNNNQRARETNIEGLLTAQKSMDRFAVALTVGGNQRRNDEFRNAFSTNGILVPEIYNLANAAVAPTTTNSEFHSGVNSAYGSAVVTVNGLWTIEATGRNDWSSTLPKENSSYFYPSVSTALIVSDLFPSLTEGGTLTYLKLRGGVAQVGSDAAPYQLQTLFNGSSNKFSGLPLYTLSNTSANAFLKPERTTGQEVGFEMSLYRDRVTLDATLYSKKTRDQIMNLTTAPATGFSSTAINAGQISNKGFEFLLSVRPIANPDGLNWTSSFNFTRNRSRVDELAPGLATVIVYQGTWGINIEARQGEPYGVLFGTGWKRDSTTNELLLTDGLPVRNTTKRVLGNVNPDWVGGWANDLRYKNWTLNTLIDIRHGGQNFSVGNWWGTYAGVLDNTLKGREVDWDDPGLVVEGIDAATGQANTTVVTAEDYAHNQYPTHEPGIFNTGFVKLREVRLSWEAPPRVASKLKLSQLNLALVGRNLLTWTDFPNFDPENSTNAGNGAQGMDMGAMPTTRSFGINVRITP